MANQPGIGAYTFVLILLAGFSCGGPPPKPAGRETQGVVGALASDTSDASRAASYAAEATRYRDIANQQRQISAAYARWTPPAGAAVTKNWNATLKASADARAAAADQIAGRIQALADFHTAAARAVSP